jgi:hypothetical protein
VKYPAVSFSQAPERVDQAQRVLAARDTDEHARTDRRGSHVQLGNG